MKREIIEGVIQGNERGYAFLIPTNPELEDFFISHSDLKGALHKDLVLAEATYGKGERTTARVLKVIERGLSEIVGTYFSSKRGGFVVADDKHYFTDVFVPFGKGLKARSGDKVVCKITAYPHRINPEGVVKEILGRQFNRKTEILSILRTYNLEDKFPSKVLKSAENIPYPTNEDVTARKDFRNLLTFTIDGDDSRDFDDAVSIEKNPDGSYCLGVHIADVSHYVKAGDIIDYEALKRGTSVYFPETVIPMLPEKLCNDVCSLMEGKDRLTLSCMIHLDKNAKVIKCDIFESVINSKARLTYNVVQKILDGDQNLIEQYNNVVPSIVEMSHVANLLIKRREENGYIDLEVKESSIMVNDNGDISVSIMTRDTAHKVIEEFMILANVCVAEKMNNSNIPCVYRIHERPDDEKFRYFLTFLNGVGVPFSFKDEITTKDYQKILNISENNPAYNVINRVMLRSMQKAKYSQILKGHFGLGEKCYCHFTSPIRRYPDLFVHRVLKDYIKNGENFVYKKYNSFAETVAKNSSERERNAIEAERAIDDYYKVLYISDYVGEEFDGVISGVTSFGLFVELENGIEGLIRIESIKGKRFECDSTHYVLSDGKTKYKLGQKVKIKVAGVNYGDKRAEFLLVN